MVILKKKLFLSIGKRGACASSGTPKKIFYSVNIKQWLAGIKIKARDKKNFSDSHFVRARKFSVSIKFCLAV